jgi:hypothetical protein
VYESFTFRLGAPEPQQNFPRFRPCVFRVYHL